MEDKFYKDEFEQFLQQQANNHRMYPTDGVWLNISRKLHGHKKWPALTIAAFTILVATVATSVYFTPKPNIFDIKSESTSRTKQSVDVTPSTNSLLSNITIQPNIKDKNLVSQTSRVPLGYVLGTQPVQVEVAGIEEKEEASLPGNPMAVVDNKSKKALSIAYVRSTIKTPLLKPATSEFVTRQSNLEEPGTKADELNASTDSKLNEGEQVVSEEKSRRVLDVSEPNKPLTDVDDKNIGDKFLQQHDGNLDMFTKPLEINKRKKFGYTVYITPSVSYRRLKENKDLNRNNNNLTGPVAANYVTDVNRLVRHKPGTGIETGVAFTYNHTNVFAVRAGLQFNVRQYNIEAYRAPTELASIALLSNTGVDTVNSYAVYRNANGNYSTELINRYFQISIPIGIEWEVIGNKNVSFNVAATVQPTYNLNNSIYILSTNFKNYMVNSGMLRDWTVNSSLEAFMNIKVGEYRWQLGPQFRYQHLPTLITEYPIREHLVDYGFKLGVSKQIK